MIFYTGFSYLKNPKSLSTTYLPMLVQSSYRILSCHCSFLKSLKFSRLMRSEYLNEEKVDHFHCDFFQVKLSHLKGIFKLPIKKPHKYYPLILQYCMNERLNCTVCMCGSVHVYTLVTDLYILSSISLGQ